jgi:tRNA pseudouridine55 synthase
MPRSTLPTLPTAALFAIQKPSGPTCMSMINSLKPLLMGSKLFMRASDISKIYASRKQGKRRPKGIDLKVGQGGTLDPLASGVLVVGAGRLATKALTRFLDCDKVCLLKHSSNNQIGGLT